MTITTTSKPGWQVVLLGAVSLGPALIAFLPLTMRSVWYLSAEQNQPFLSEGRVLWFLVSFTIAFAPFFGAIVALLSVRAAGRGWRGATQIAAWWACGLGLVALAAAGLGGGGF
ncbi:hypothetical protein KM427_20005 [Nocardioides sp. LMS-CY]|uniref:hypothetical protein n=1 Tax=Nocardioides sp. (strain LMS-CY) TaxID=2840457 RepID=UPI001C004CFE|nr:hypothetical protein [Nocardioides sp. LMS-CY]QWF21206.1 hypothetical protein KM427_20005 [Nocardioides sp. LMS-CY]